MRTLSSRAHETVTECGALFGLDRARHEVNRSYAISEIDVTSASERDLNALAELIRSLESERVIEDPPIPIPVILDRLRGRPQAAYRDWIVTDGTGPVAHATLRRPSGEGRSLRCDVVLEVAAGHRRRGIGRALLEEIVSAVGDHDDVVYFANTSDRVPSGEIFAERIGAECALLNVGMQLDLRAVDRTLLDAWSELNPAGYELTWIDGPTPERYLEHVITAYQSMLDSRPRGELRIERVVVDAAVLRALPWGDSAIRAGRQRRLLLAVHMSTGTTAGFTEVSYDARVPHLITQAGTGTSAEHRGADIAKWLKARMLKRVLSEWSDARIMRTGNATSNTAMLSVNRRLGFVATWMATNWQLSAAHAWRYLATKRSC